MKGRFNKTKNLIAGILCALLCASAVMILSGAYQKILPDARKRITVGVFSDSYWKVQNGYSYQILNDAIRIFEDRHPDMKVDYVSGILEADYSEWLSEQLLSEEAPDVFFVLGDDFNLFVNSGALKDLSPLMARDPQFDENAFYSSAIAGGKYHGKQYALPYECAPKLMFVNKTILDAEGIALPGNDWTWDDFYKICQQVTKDTNKDGLTDQFGEVGYTWQEAFESNGVTLFNQDGTECYLASPGVKDAVEFIEKMKKLNAGYNVSEHDFDLGNVAFRPMSFSEFRAYKSYPLSVKKYSGFEWGCIPMPSGPAGKNISTLDTLLLGMNEHTANPQAAWEFMKILTCDPQVQSEIFNYSDGVSVLRKVTESEQTLQRLIENSGSAQSLNLSILSKAVENSVSAPKFLGVEEADDRVNQAVNAIINGNENINMELILWNREINKYLKER